MQARIYQPCKSAMQGASGKTKYWIIEFISSDSKSIEPIMGWTASNNMLESQVKIKFLSLEKAVKYATNNQLMYTVDEYKSVKPKKHKPYVDNFKYFKPE